MNVATTQQLPAPRVSQSSLYNKVGTSHHNKTSATMVMIMNDSASILFFACKVAIVCIVFWNHFLPTHGFTLNNPTVAVGGVIGSMRQSRSSSSSSSYSSYTCQQLPYVSLAAASRGMGMGTTNKSKTKKNKSKRGGIQKSTATTTTSPFDVSASLIRLEKKYDQLMLDAAKTLLQKEAQNEADEESSIWDTPSNSPSMMTSEYVIAARAAVSISSKSSSQQPQPQRLVIPDWVPIAQLCLKRPESEYQDGASDVMVQTAISAYCRELSHVAMFGAPIFSTIARNQLQYSVESVESFRKYVYEEVVEGKAKQNKDETMTKAEARETLGLTNNNNPDTIKVDIKQAYRKLSFDLHPDRFQGTLEECEQAAQQFARVKLAYETLSSGVRGQDGISWYESLGGRARTGFVGPINLLPLTAAQEYMTRHQAEGAIVGLDPTLVQSFVARHLRSE